ncbi:glycosyltransferase family 39 protein [Alkalinema pantanalense CENA528]|uniref:glycosyltransferase family 39 protein n=1 Tax=Alkalinema pantanalense TaxID=1620705 RepID=UPI003D6FEBD7
MNVSRIPWFHFWLLAIVLLLGTGLRLLNLDGKPLWMDEVITALFSLGHTYDEVPVGQAVGLTQLAQLFTLQPETTCGAIAQTVATQSVHPPLFFCWLHSWLNVLQPFLQAWQAPLAGNLSWELRSLPVLLGIGAIGAVYGLGRSAFGRRTGLMAAACMAVSPFAVYLSQEARHYTLPMVVITLALLALVQIQQNFEQGRSNRNAWISWVLLNGVGFYIHYFCILATIAQGIALLGTRWISAQLERRSTNYPQKYQFSSFWPTFVTGTQPQGIFLASLGLLGIIGPWLPTFISHMTRPETDWLNDSIPPLLSVIVPLYYLPIGWSLMVISPPVEGNPISWQIPMVLLVVAFSIWLARQLWQGWQKIGQIPELQGSLLVLGGFIAAVVAEFWAIAILLQKDLTHVPRYNFIYYPAICVLLAAGLAMQSLPRQSREPLPPTTPRPRWRSLLKSPAAIVLVVGFLSSLCVVFNGVFQKPYQPNLVAQRMMQADAPQATIQVVMGYQTWQEMALGLSFALALEQEQNRVNGSDRGSPRLDNLLTGKFAFLNSSQGYPQLWKNLTQLPPTDILWIIAPGLRRSDFPETLALGSARNPQSCQRDPQRYDRIGIPYQGYRCDLATR